MPIILLVGQAGAGKDTVAGFLAKNHNAVTIAQADPMKRFIKQVFGFTEEQLWGPSERRSEEVDVPSRVWDGFPDRANSWFRELWSSAPLNAYTDLVGWLEEFIGTPVSAREALQTLGTEWGRSIDQNVWVQAALRMSRRVLAGEVGYRRHLGSCCPPEVPPNWVVITDGRFRNEVLAVKEAGGYVVRIDTPGAGLTDSAASHASEQEQKGIPESWFDVVLTNDKSHGLESLESAVDRMVQMMVDPPLRFETSHLSNP